MKSLAIRYHEHGAPDRVLRLEEMEVPPPGKGEVLLKMLAAPINPSDLGSIAGSYGQLPELPAVAGREGVAEVLDTASDVAGLQSGDRVLAPEGAGTWREFIVAPAASLIGVPPGIPIAQAAMASINPPTARLLLDRLPDHQPGEWIVQNAASSAVGYYVIELARQRGLRTINIVRRPEWIEKLKAIGANEVLVQSDDLAKQVREICGEKPPRLALNSVGGESAYSLIKCLADGGELVTFGGMTSEPVRFPTRYLIFNDVRLTGFWLNRWKRRASAEQIRELFKQVFLHIADGRFKAPIEEEYPLTGFAEAVARAAASGRHGKILFRMTANPGGESGQP